MSAVTMPRSTSLSFPRLIRSEWIKLRSVRSTVWCYAIVVVLTLAMASLLGVVDTGVERGAPATVANQLIVTIGTASVSLTALVVGVLGVLIITGEYGTGQIRSTFTAAPGRTGVVLAKAFVLALATFVVSAVCTWIGVAITTALQAGRDIRPDLADPAVFMPVFGSSVYVTLVALLAFGIGLLVKSSAGGIAITLGILLVLPTIVQIIGGLTNQQWIIDASQFLPSSAGAQLYTFDSGGQQGDGLHLGGWGGFGVLAGEVVVVGAIALAAARSRDV